MNLTTFPLIFLAIFLAINLGLIEDAHCNNDVLKTVNGTKSRILFISFYSTKSHQIVYEPLLLKLAERGHEVTIVSPVPYKNKVGDTNIRYIETLSPAQLGTGAAVPNMFQLKESKIASILNMFLSPYFFIGPTLLDVCQKSYQLPQIKGILSGEEKFDLVIFSSVVNECLYGLVHFMAVPVILLNQVSVFPWIAMSMGTPLVLSHSPSHLSQFTEKMTFVQRLLNVVSFFTSLYVKDYMYNPRIEAIYREFVDPNLPSIKEIEANASLVLCNSHVSFTRPKPLMPDIVDVGGMHLSKTTKPLPKDLEDFIAGAGDHGFILFSMGSALKGSEMPEKYRQVILRTFANLKQRIIWKWETEEMEGLPKNVRLSKWLPQEDVLAHKKIKAFITHGGHGSVQEAIKYGVPLVGFPMFIDQAYNIRQAEDLGFAIFLEFTLISEEILGNAIDQILYNSSYRETAQRLSGLFHDQIDDPLDRAVWHVEYVMRHQGARHLRSAARDLTTIQYFSLDVIGVILTIFAFVGYINFIVVRALIRKCCLRSMNKINSQRKSSKAKGGKGLRDKKIN